MGFREFITLGRLAVERHDGWDGDAESCVERFCWLSLAKKRILGGHMQVSSHRETEVKLRVSNLRALRGRLRELRAESLGRVHEFNMLFDTPDRILARRGELVRLRLVTDQTQLRTATLTFKGPSVADGPYKVREETEHAVANPDLFRQALGALNLQTFFQYEKHRTTFRLPGLPHLLVQLDETPIGNFLELEGEPQAIDRAARRLGYSKRDYLTESYLGLYLQICRRKKLAPGDMLFSRRRLRTRRPR